MDWILQYLLLVTMTISSAYDFLENVPGPYQYHGHIQHGLYTNKRLQGRSADRPVQRMSERSISVTSSDIQGVQEVEKRRLFQVDPLLPRSENGTVKILNNRMKYPSLSSRRGMDESPSVVHFPGRTSAQKFEPEIPKECQELGICENVPNYPHDIVDSIISRLGDKLRRFHVDELDPEITQRISPDDSPEIPLCNSRESIIKPQAAKGKNGNWYVILNSKESVLQGFRVEICHNQYQTCAENILSFNTGYTSKCKQKYVHRPMAAIDVDNREVLYDIPFRVPSCCSCVAMHTNRK